MRNKKIHPRAKYIMLRLCKAETYVPVAEIAKELGVSAKTVVRELPEVEARVNEYQLTLDKKTGAGIGIRGSEEAKQQICALLEASEEELSYSPEERRTMMTGKLLQNQEPVKLYEFTSTLKVTEGTISNDLDKLEPWFNAHQIILIRKPGLGIYIEGTEQNIRKAIVHYIYENINEDQLLTALYENLAEPAQREGSAVEKSEQYLLNLVDVKIIRQLEISIREVEAELQYKLADSAYVALIVHLALAIQRIRKNEKIEIEQIFLIELKKKREYAIAEQIAHKMATVFAVSVPEDEIAYITMHLLGARNQYTKNGTSIKVLDNYHLVKIAKQMMKIAQEETGKYLVSHEKLLIGLVNHLGPSISRLKMNLDIRNPLLKDMQAHYPELLAVSRKCAAVLERELRMKLPEAEIAYIAMHLGAAIEDGDSMAKMEYRVAIACPTGMGSSRMLATRVRKEYGNLTIVDLISAIHLDEAYLNYMRVQFIISTVSIQQCTLPVIVVNSLLLKDDREKIDRQIHMLSNAGPEHAEESAVSLDFRERLEAMQEYGQSILEILKNLFVVRDEASQTIDEAISRISGMLMEEQNKREELRRALLDREAHGGTLIAGQRMILLHCRSTALSFLQFGIIQFRHDLSQGKEEKQIQTAIVMLAPDNSSKQNIETIGYISKTLLDRWGFIEILHKGDQEMIYLELVNLYKEFYQEKSKKLLEGYT